MKPDAEFEELLAQCIERWTAEGQAAIEELAHRHPASADRLRERMRELTRMGLLGAPTEVEQIGRFRLVERLGHGGMASVHRAFDPQRGHEVALKVAHAPLVDDPRAKQRFEREVRAVSELSHPSIVRVFDAGEHRGRPWFSMELVRGATLAQVIDELRRREVAFEMLTTSDVRRIVDPAPAQEQIESHWGRTWTETLVRLVLDVAEALEHAHSHGIVHRDVKPSNVLVRHDGRALLFDLGLARMESAQELTHSGDFAGTPYYVAPEQIAGARTVDGRADVFSLGVTLYELLTLRRPFEGRTSAEVFRKILSLEPEPPRRAHPWVPRDLETVCLTALEKDRRQRYASAGDLAADLRRFLEFRPVLARPRSAFSRARRWIKRRPATAAALALGALVLIGLPVGLGLANQAVRAEQKRTEAAALDAGRQARRRQEVGEFLTELFRLSNSDPRQGETVTAREVLDEGLRRLQAGASGDPQTQAALSTALGRVYANLGLVERARPLFDRAFAILQRELGEDHPEVASALADVARANLLAGDAAAAEATASRSLAAFERGAAAAEESASACRLTLALALWRRGEVVRAKAELDLVIVQRTVSNGERSEPVAEGRFELGRLAFELGDLVRASDELAQAAAIREGAWSRRPFALAETKELLARVRRARGESELADRLESEALALRQSLVQAATSGVDVDAELLAEALRPPRQAEYDQSFQAGITALQSRDHRAAIAAFERCLDLRPRQATCAYNAACGYALLGDADRALDWLERAIDWGFGTWEEHLETAHKDKDLAAVRDLPRAQSLFERMETRGRRSSEYAARVDAWVPERRAPAAGWPLVVVLHADGSTRNAVIEGVWRELAEELGFALLAPSAAHPTLDDPSHGMAWVINPSDFARRPERYGEPVVGALRAFREAHAIDPERIVLVGEREAARLAFDVAVRSGQPFRAVLLVDGLPDVSTSAAAARNAAVRGLEVRALLGMSFDGRGEIESALARWLARMGFEGRVRTTANLSRAELASELAALSAELGRGQ